MSHIELHTIDPPEISENILENPDHEPDIHGPRVILPNRLKEYAKAIQKVLCRHENVLKVAALIVFCFSVSIAGIINVGFERSAAIFGFGVFLSFCVIYMFLRDKFGGKIFQLFMKPAVDFVKRNWNYLRWLTYFILVVLIILWLVLDTSNDSRRFISFGGLLVFLFISYVFSKHRAQVKWRPVLWGIALQFLLALFILRTDVGLKVFRLAGKQVEYFLSYTDTGSKFVFGDLYTMHFFAFKVLPLIIFFSSIISILYYLEVMQLLILKMSWLMKQTMGTSGAESLSAAGNIFIGQTESPLMIRPFLERMTMSELHAVMTGGFATIAGSVLGVYIAFGAPASHLLSASIMSAPAALAISKLLYPETENPETANDEEIEMPKPSEKNMIEAAANGSSTAISLVANVAANLITFLALLSFVNGILGYLGVLLNLPDLSFKYICSYVLRPVAFLMGVEWADTPIVAELIGTKTFLNEFVAYSEFSKYVTLRKTGGRGMSIRSEVITTYALCGFSNFGSIGIQLGGIGAMAPSRRGDLAKIALRAMIGGTFACFMTACIAGMLY